MRPIPKFRRDKFTFISNLNETTACADLPITYKRNGYLLSEHYSTPRLERLAAEVKSRNNLLISDNGNFSRMKAVAKGFEKSGNGLLNAALKEKTSDGEVSKRTLAERQALIAQIHLACVASSEEMDTEDVLAKQLLIDPDYVIGMEDFTITVLMLCGLMHPVFAPIAEDVLKHQQSTNRIFEKQLAGEYGNLERQQLCNLFLVLHSYDYRSAYQAAALSHSTNPCGVAISFGGPMKSRRWITSLDIGDATVELGEKLPEPYLISTAIGMGVSKGVDPGMPVHILGVGSPILIALFGYMFSQSRAVSIDSTAPFKDANVGTIYGSRNAFLKMDMYKLAAYHLIENTAYSSTTPFFQAFEKDYPSNWSAIRSELGISSNSSVKNVTADLKSNPKLVERYIPFFSKMRSGDDEMINTLRVCRAGHNYWILHNICNSVRKRMDDRNSIANWTEYQVSRYERVASKKWRTATRKSFELMSSNA